MFYGMDDYMDIAEVTADPRPQEYTEAMIDAYVWIKANDLIFDGIWDDGVRLDIKKKTVDDPGISMVYNMISDYGLDRAPRESIPRTYLAYPEFQPNAAFSPDMKSILILAYALRRYTDEVVGGDPKKIARPGFRAFLKRESENDEFLAMANPRILQQAFALRSGITFNGRARMVMNLAEEYADAWRSESS